MLALRARAPNRGSECPVELRWWPQGWRSSAAGPRRRRRPFSMRLAARWRAAFRSGLGGPARPGSAPGGGVVTVRAHFQKETTLENVLAAPMGADPLGLFDCCSTTDGAAAILLVAEERVPEFTQRPVWLAGSGAATDTLALHDRKDIAAVDATSR